MSYIGWAQAGKKEEDIKAKLESKKSFKVNTLTMDPSFHAENYGKNVVGVVKEPSGECAEW